MHGVLRCWSPSCFLDVVIYAGNDPGVGVVAQHPVQQRQYSSESVFWFLFYGFAGRCGVPQVLFMKDQILNVECCTCVYVEVKFCFVF